MHRARISCSIDRHTFGSNPPSRQQTKEVESERRSSEATFTSRVESYHSQDAAHVPDGRSIHLETVLPGSLLAFPPSSSSSLLKTTARIPTVVTAEAGPPLGHQRSPHPCCHPPYCRAPMRLRCHPIFKRSLRFRPYSGLKASTSHAVNPTPCGCHLHVSTPDCLHPCISPSVRLPMRSWALLPRVHLVRPGFTDPLPSPPLSLFVLCCSSGASCGGATGFTGLSAAAAMAAPMLPAALAASFSHRCRCLLLAASATGRCGNGGME